MINNVLRPLNWQQGNSLIEAQADSALHSYEIAKDEAGGFLVIYVPNNLSEPAKNATGFGSINEAKKWAESHYAEKMTDWLRPEIVAGVTNWFKAAKPSPTDKDALTQFGCHVEEFAEMFLSTGTPKLPLLLAAVSETFKQGSSAEAADFFSKADKVELLDSLCDQIVTAIGLAYMLNMDLLGALNEVNNSNWSKFEGGRPVLDSNGKIQKGADYFAPNLEKFVGGSDEQLD